MNVDRPRQRDASSASLLFVNAIAARPENKTPISAMKPMMKPSRTTRLLGNDGLAEMRESIGSLRGRSGAEQGQMPTGAEYGMAIIRTQLWA